MITKLHNLMKINNARHFDELKMYGVTGFSAGAARLHRVTDGTLVDPMGGVIELMAGRYGMTKFK